MCYIVTRSVSSAHLFAATQCIEWRQECGSITKFVGHRNGEAILGDKHRNTSGSAERERVRFELGKHLQRPLEKTAISSKRGLLFGVCALCTQAGIGLKTFQLEI